MYVFIDSSTLFSGISPVVASQMGSDANEYNSIGIVIKELNDAMIDSRTSSASDLGDDKEFTFIPGFGKNSGKD